VIRDEEWPELLALRRELDHHRISWVNAPYIDYPIKGWILHAIRRNPGAFVRSNLALVRITAEFKATHIHAFNPLYVANFIWALGRTNLPLVYRCGDRPVLHNAFYRAIWTFIRKRTSHFVADSAFIEKQLHATGVDARRISVVYAPAPRRKPSPPTQLPQEAMAEGAFRFVYVGEISRNKGVAVLTTAFREIALRYCNAHLLMAGRISSWRGDDWARALLEQVSADAIVSARVHFLGFVENVADLFRSCHVHIAPSLREEPYGLVVVEAKQEGIPSVIFPSGGMRELVRHGTDGFIVHQRDAQGLAGMLERYLTDPTLALRQGEAARASLDLLGVQDFGNKWRAVYQSVA
jgi:glycosyltransferase involved in cell wall biosynthesis